jgi:hypothetical protein
VIFGMDGIFHFKATITTIEVTRRSLKTEYGPHSISEELFIFKILGQKKFFSKHQLEFYAPFNIEFYESNETGERLFDAIMVESLLHHVYDDSLVIDKLVIQSSLDIDKQDRRTQKVSVYGKARHSILNEELLPYVTDFFADDPFCTILRHILEANIGYDFTRYPYARQNNSST